MTFAKLIITRVTDKLPPSYVFVYKIFCCFTINTAFCYHILYYTLCKQKSPSAFTCVGAFYLETIECTIQGIAKSPSTMFTYCKLFVLLCVSTDSMLSGGIYSALPTELHWRTSDRTRTCDLSIKSGCLGCCEPPI